MKDRSQKTFRLAGILLALAGLVLAILWFSGAFETGKVPPGEGEKPPGLNPPKIQGKAVREDRPAFYIAVGTISPWVRSALEPRRRLPHKYRAG
jgi:hypothetical protein